VLFATHGWLMFLRYFGAESCTVINFNDVAYRLCSCALQPTPRPVVFRGSHWDFSALFCPLRNEYIDLNDLEIQIDIHPHSHLSFVIQKQFHVFQDYSLNNDVRLTS